jgi:hypothetical protein
VGRVIQNSIQSERCIYWIFDTPSPQCQENKQNKKQILEKREKHNLGLGLELGLILRTRLSSIEVRELYLSLVACSWLSGLND